MVCFLADRNYIMKHYVYEPLKCYKEMTAKHIWNLNSHTSVDENGKTDDQSVHKLTVLRTGTLNGKKTKIQRNLA